MLKTNQKAQKKSLEFFKSSLPCYGVSENRFFESELKTIHDQTIFDFGCKHKLKVSKTKLSPGFKLMISKIKNFETPYTMC